MPTEPSNITVANPLLATESQLVGRFRVFGDTVYAMLLDRLAAKYLKDTDFWQQESEHSFQDLMANAQILRVLSKNEWNKDDMRLFDTFWRAASHSALFAEEFEPERHRVRACVDRVKAKLASRQSCLSF